MRGNIKLNIDILNHLIVLRYTPHNTYNTYIKGRYLPIFEKIEKRL